MGGVMKNNKNKTVKSKKVNNNRVKKPIFIYNETFRTNIYVSYGIPAEEYRRSVKKYMGVELDTIPEGVYGKMNVFEENKTGNGIIWIWTKDKDVSHLAHEAMHVVINDLTERGIKVSNESDEIFCYYLQMIIRKVLENG